MFSCTQSRFEDYTVFFLKPVSSKEVKFLLSSTHLQSSRRKYFVNYEFDIHIYADFLVLRALIILSSNQLSFLKYIHPFLSYDQNKFKKINFLIIN